MHTIAFLAVVVVGGDLGNTSSDTLTLDRAVQLALAGNQGLRVTRLRADAAAERVTPAGAWSDPIVTLGLMNRPFLDPGRTDQPMTMNHLQLTQRFSWPGKRSFARNRARSLAAAERFDAHEAEAALTAQVTQRYYDVAFVDRRLRVMRQTLELLRNFGEITASMYASGSALQTDVLQAQVAIAGIIEDITVAEQRRIALMARLNVLMGRAPATPIDAVRLPVVLEEIPPADSLMHVAGSQRPALRAARARVRAARSGRRVAQRAGYPDVTVTLGYGHRPQFDDLATLMVGFTVPVFGGARYGPVRREAEILAAAAESHEADVYTETFAQLTELVAEANRARNLSRLYANSILPQARAAVESALSAYRVARVDYSTLMNSELIANRYAVESIRLRADYYQAVAAIEALIGADLGGGL